EKPGGDGLFCIEGRIGCGLRAEFYPGQGAIDFVGEDGTCVLRYAELHVIDATGWEVPSFLSFDGDKVTIVVDDRGALYPLVVDPLVTSPSWTAESNESRGWFGCSVGTAGDVNGDGYSDVIVGAEGYDNGQNDEGRVFVFHGSAGGLALNPAWTAESNQAKAYFGHTVGTAGDVNGDGYSDVIVGADGYTHYETEEGAAFVYHGSAAGLAPSPDWTAEGNQAGAWFGCSVGTAGDVNGDGYSDVIVGSEGHDNGQTDEGRAYVYHGSASGLASGAAWIGEEDQAKSYYATSVATAGDVNGDGFSDVFVGADGYTNDETEEGRAFVYHGSASGLGANPAWTVESNKESAWLGCSGGTAGDVNGDGYSDVFVGAFGYSNGQTEEGRAFVYHGSAQGLEVNPGWVAESNQANSWFGSSGGAAGDVNGDGYSDVFVGADGYSNGQTEEGAAFVYYGSVVGVVPNPAWMDESNQAGAGFGCAGGTAGDVNGDGYADVIVGADGYANGQNQEGRAFVYHGSADGTTGTEGGIAVPDAQSLISRVAPNPFGTTIQLTYTLPGRGHVRLAVFNAAGQEVAVLNVGDEEAGPHTVDWNGRGARGTRLPSGVYFVQLRFKDHMEARKIVLTR
ncbi:MAG: FG-GAP repeat protein, partial [Candidatus Latescibacterota bacterium]